MSLIVAVTVLSLSYRCSITVLPLSCHCPITVLSLSCRCPITVLSLSYNCPVSVLSLSYHCPVTVLSLSCHCPVTVPWASGPVVSRTPTSGPHPRADRGGGRGRGCRPHYLVSTPEGPTGGLFCTIVPFGRHINTNVPTLVYIT